MHALCKEMNAALGGRGGGREMQQGSAACTRGDIEAFLRRGWGNNSRRGKEWETKRPRRGIYPQRGCF